MRREVVLGLVLLLMLLPLADAKGSYGGGSGRRSTCAPVDTNGDGLVSDAERADQCSSSGFWPIAAVMGGTGLVGFLAWRKLRGG